MGLRVRRRVDALLGLDVEILQLSLSDSFRMTEVETWGCESGAVVRVEDSLRSLGCA